MTLTIDQNTDFNTADMPINQTDAQARSYRRVLVFLDGTPATEQAIATASDLARDHDADLVMVYRNQAGAQAYIDNRCRSLQVQGIRATGYVVSSNMKTPPAWLVDSEKADAVVISQKPAGWLSAWFGGDATASLRANTDTDVFNVT